MENEITPEKIRQSGIFNNIDLELGRFVTRGKPEDDPVLFLAGALASWAVQHEHSCCDLNRLSGKVLNEDEEDEKRWLRLPSLDVFRSALEKQPAMTAVIPEQPLGKQPLVLDPAGRLYLNRYYHYERGIARHLLERLPLNRDGGRDWNELKSYEPGKIAGLSSLFRNGNDTGGPDYQQAAIFLSHARNFSIITGGPGTGKTTVMTALLAWEIEDNPEIRIRLCAPTGKAANQMKTSIIGELKNINCQDSVKERLKALQDCCTTVDKLLRPIPHTPNFRMNKNNPIDADLVVLDEASMSSLSQLAHLFDALRPETRLVLIGDKDQLSSVEAGSVLADLITEASLNVMPAALSARFERMTSWKFPAVADSRPLSGTAIELQKNIRSRNAPYVCKFSSAIRQLASGGDLESLCRDIAQMDDPQFSFYGRKLDEKTLKNELSRFLIPAGEMVRQASTGNEADLRAAFDLLDSFRILCAVRRGLTGVENVNKLAASLLNLRSRHSVGMPLIVLENTPMLGLSNGDIGLVWKKKGSDQSMVMFRDGEKFRPVRFSEMPPHESVFAMTVHKSQGSSIDHVMILLPPKPVPILTRELLYTAITRSKNTVRLYASGEILKKTLETVTVRYSGLAGQLKEMQ